MVALIEGQERCKACESVIRAAARNKVLLHVLRSLNVRGRLRDEQELRLRRIVRTVETISKALRGRDYAFFKLLKPVTYVPADVDVLVASHQLSDAVGSLLELGYKVVELGPYHATLAKGSSVVDVYVHPNLGGTMFLNGQRLLECSSTKAFYGVELIALEDYAEALVTAAHAVYKERIYTLNDYFTTRRWLSKGSIRLAWELGCTPALELAMRLNRGIELGTVEAPYKIPLPLWLSVWFRKAANDRLTRATLVNVVTSVTSKRGAELLISKFTRETY